MILTRFPGWNRLRPSFRLFNTTTTIIWLDVQNVMMKSVTVFDHSHLTTVITHRWAAPQLQFRLQTPLLQQASTLHASRANVWRQLHTSDTLHSIRKRTANLSREELICSKGDRKCWFPANDEALNNNCCHCFPTFGWPITSTFCTVSKRSSTLPVPSYPVCSD